MTRLADVNICIEKIKQLPITYDAETVQRCIEVLSNSQTIDAEPVRHGKWIPYEDEDGEHYGDMCSECGEWYVMPFGKVNFCPNCGCRMDAK